MGLRRGNQKRTQPLLVSLTDTSLMLDWQKGEHPPGCFWRVLRSASGYAATSEPPGDNAQVLVSEGLETHARDERSRTGPAYYTVFARGPDGTWLRCAQAKVRPHRRLRRRGTDAQRLLASSADRECNANPGRPAAFGWQMETMKPDDGKLPH